MLLFCARVWVISYLLIDIWDCRHFQLAKQKVFDQESDFQVQNNNFRRPEANAQELRVSISHRKSCPYMPPLFFGNNSAPRRI